MRAAIYVGLIVLAGILIIIDVSRRKSGEAESIDLKAYFSWRFGIAAIVLIVLVVAAVFS